VCGRTLNIDSK
jgi:hypothetical protein